MMIKTPSIPEMLQQLIALPSVSSPKPEFNQSNAGVIEKLAEWCSQIGFCCEILPIPEQVGKFNLIATLGQGEGGLVLAGHTDTVPYNLDLWQSNPFELTEKDGRFYGLGSADMKAFFAIALMAVQTFKNSKLREPIILVATADEESTLSGAKALVKLGKPKGRYAIVGEPTNLRPIRLHKGIFTEAIRVIGRAGHSSDPALGNSALEGMHKVINALLAWRTILQNRYQHPAFTIPTPTLNLGHIHGGDNPNRICGECELHIDLRLLPQMHIATIRAELHEIVKKALLDTGLQVTCRPLFDGMEAMETAADAQIVRMAEELTGYSSGAVMFGTEAPYLQQLGMQVVVLGAGNIEQAHQPNEYVALAQLNPMQIMIEQMIKRFCL